MLPNKEFESSELIIVHLVNLVLNELGPLFKLFMALLHVNPLGGLGHHRALQTGHVQSANNTDNKPLIRLLFEQGV